MDKKYLKVFSSAFALSLVLTGCASGSSSNKSERKTKPKVEFKSTVENSGTVDGEATLKVGVLSGDTLVGLWNPVFYLNAEDYQVIGLMVGNTFPTDETYRLKQDDKEAPVAFHFDKDKKETTLTIHKDLKWSNGEDVTSKDIIATYNIMGNPEYKENVRYNDSLENIEGMKEYHEGKAKTISGIVAKDDKTVVIKYKEAKPSLQWGDGFIENFLNAGQVEKVTDFTKFAEAELNKKPLSYGPYVISKEVNGESVLLEANPHFYKKDKIKNKKVEVKVVQPSQASAMMKNGEIDLMGNLTPNVWEGSKDSDKGTILGKDSFYMSYVGFKTGKFDKDKGEVVVDPNAKLSDVKLRQALMYAVDRDQINERIYKGLRFTPTGSGMYPAATGLTNPNAKLFKKDVEKAKQLLDEAGYKDTNGDGIREGKDGKPFSLNFAIRNTGSDYDQTLADTFLKSWKEVGIDVKLNDSKLMAPKDWSQRVQADDPTIEIFQGAWQYGTNPNREELLGAKAPLNLYRYMDDNIKEAFKTQQTAEMFDIKKLTEAYNKFDDQVAEVLPYFPLSWNTDLAWVSKRVKNYDMDKVSHGDQNIYELELLK